MPWSARCSCNTASKRAWGSITRYGYGVSAASSGMVRFLACLPLWSVASRSGRPWRNSAGVMPSGRSSSNVRGWSISARDARHGSGRSSMTRGWQPSAASCAASVNPVGPAPTTSTSVSVIGSLGHCPRWARAGQGSTRRAEQRLAQAPPPGDGLTRRRTAKVRVPGDPGLDVVPHRTADGPDPQERAERLRVVARRLGVVPVVDPPILTGGGVRQPQLGGEAGKAGEERRVDDAQPPEQRVSDRAAAKQAQSEADNEDAGLDRLGSRDNGLAEHVLLGSVGEAQPRAPVINRATKLLTQREPGPR